MLPQPGRVLLTREAPAGEAAHVPARIEWAPAQRVVLVQTDRQKMVPELVLHSIYSARAGRFFDRPGRETTVAHLNMAGLGELPAVRPPLNSKPVVEAWIRSSCSSSAARPSSPPPPPASSKTPEPPRERAGSGLTGSAAWVSMRV